MAAAKLKVFTADINTWVHQDVFTLLGEPSHRFQASIRIVATTKAAAIDYIRSLPRTLVGEPRTSEMRVAGDSTTEAMVTAGLFDAPAVFVSTLNGRQVVRIDADGPVLIGKILRESGSYEFEPAGTITLKVTPAARERLARHLYVSGSPADWRPRAELGWDNRDERINRDKWVALANEMIAALEGK